ncbi:hypothetical protein Purlil1_13303 [Purpureocillium lilacinum]|uniref:DUF7703 domain-containing protein n=1 Tax=Purpureocillium lilacinum TaxID=33203 RepID=A0ABR0BEE8_PURLI|nr:hypothetical protein Purlil1_13303 [Purpureocillium lilacinum]
MDSNMPKYEAATGVAAYLILGFNIIAIYNVIELTFMICERFKRHSRLYYWVLLVTTYGIAAYAVGSILKIKMPSPKSYVYLTLIEVGWIAMVTGHSMVLWSRLHLLLNSPFWLKTTIYMIVFNAIMCHILPAILTCDAKIINLVILASPYSFDGRIQVTIFSIQEFIISAIYISRALNLIRLRTATREYWGCGRLMQHLIVVNIVIILLDTTILGLVYAGYSDVQTSYQSFVYSVKLKLEFSILDRLGDLQEDEKARSACHEDNHQ